MQMIPIYLGTALTARREACLLLRTLELRDMVG